MSKLRQISAKLDMLNDELKKRSRIIYALSRDKDANLIITFDDGQIIKLPIVPFRPYQIDVQKKLFVEGIKRFLLSRPRRSGKEVESWNLLIQGAVESPGLYIIVYPTNVRARAVLWDGSALIDDKSIKFLDMVPKRLVDSINNQDMKIKLTNGSVLWVLGSDVDPDKLRGTNPRGIVYSEFAYQDPRVFYVMLPALRQNEGWMIGQSTFDGMNHFYQLIEQNKDNPLWYCRVDSIETLVDENGNCYITPSMIQEDIDAGMPAWLVSQEYFGQVQLNYETKFFSHALAKIYDDKRLIQNLMLPGANVYTAWDIGMNDSTAIVLFQIKRVDNYLKPIIIGYIESNNRDLSYYVTEIRHFCSRYNITIKEHFIPHDGQKRDFNTGKNTVDFMREMDEKAYIVPRPTSKENAIEAIRRKLYVCDFNKENTQRLIDCLSNYSKEYDDKIGTYKAKPKHDWSSHGVDAFQTMVLALDANMIIERQRAISYYV